MSNIDNIKQLSIQNVSGSYDTRDVAMEAQNADVSFTGGGQVIEDITESGVVVASVKSVAKTIKDINTDLSNKANASDLSGKADLDSETGLVDADQLPDDIDDIVEGYYKESDGKFYKNYNSSTQTYSNEITGQTGKIYVDKLTNGMFRWAGSPLNQFVKIVNLGDMDLDDISNVDIGTVQDGESLVYDSVRGKWVNKMQTAHFVTIPTVTVGTYTYNGSPHGPTVTGKSADFDTYVTTTGATAVDAGSYTLRFSLKNAGVDMWSDLTTADKTYNYTINKANGSVVLASNAVTLDDNNKVVSVNVTSTTGTVSASSSATGIATVTATNSAVTITATEETGSATITVTAAASTNYKSASASIAVTASFLVIKSFSLATDTELKRMLDAYYTNKVTLAQLGWQVGDTRVMHFNEMDAPSPQTSGSKWAAQDITIEIVAMEHTDLATPINGHSKSCITVQTREVMNNNTSDYNQNGHIYVNGDSSNDKTFTKWSNLYMRTYLNSTVLGAIPSGDFKSSIKQSKHYRHTNYNTADDELVTDTLFLPSYPEIFGTASYSYYVPTTHTEGTQFEWYQTQANRVKQGNNNGNKNGTNQYWWEGSASSNYYSSYGYRWCRVHTSGNASNGIGATALGLAPAFAL